MHRDTGGAVVDLRGIQAHLPPMPPRHMIMGHDLPEHEQCWNAVRPELPSFLAREVTILSGEEYEIDDVLSWEDVRREEIIGKTGYDPYKYQNNKYHKVPGIKPDIDYHEPSLTQFRNRELERIRNGAWFYNCGEPTYMTGAAYLLFAWWPLDSGKAEYRDYINKIFYVLEVADLDYGLNGALVAGPRGLAKTTIAGVFLYHRVLLSKKQHFGIQSKNDPDAQELFIKAVAVPMSELPDFLVPIHNIVGNARIPKAEIEFYAPLKKHPNTKWDSYLRRKQKKSKIDYKAAIDNAYDGGTLRVLVQDEIGKLSRPNSVAERFRISKFSVRRGDKKSGIIVGITTVGEMEKGGQEFKEVWDNSDPNEKNANGSTQSGCIRYFVSSLDTVCLDKYGRSDRDAARRYHMESLAHAKRKSDAEYFAYLRQNPFEENDMFRMGGGTNEYNLEILLNRQEILESDLYYNGICKRGDFVWEKKWEKVKFVENSKNGKWDVSWLPPEELRNNVKQNIGYMEPMNGHLFSAALDPVNKNNIKWKYKASEVACTIYRKHWEGDEDNSLLSDNFVADYRFRHSDTTKDYENVLAGLFFYGVPALVEDNQFAAIRFFQQNGFDVTFPTGKENTFVQKPPEFLVRGSSKSKVNASPGISATGGEGGIISVYSDFTATYIERHGHKLNHRRIVRDWIKFDPENTKEFDTGVAASYTILATHRETEDIRKKQAVVISLGNIFGKRRVVVR